MTVRENRNRVVIENLIVRDRRFVVVQDMANAYYHAIEDKYIDSEGKLTQTLNGFDTHASQDLNFVIDSVRKIVEIEYLVSQGMSKVDAMAQVFNFNEEQKTMLASMGL